MANKSVAKSLQTANLWVEMKFHVTALRISWMKLRIRTLSTIITLRNFYKKCNETRRDVDFMRLPHTFVYDVECASIKGLMASRKPRVDYGNVDVFIDHKKVYIFVLLHLQEFFSKSTSAIWLATRISLICISIIYISRNNCFISF